MVELRRSAVVGVFLISIGCGGSAGGVNIWDAVEMEDTAAIKTFADSGGSLNVKNLSGETPLWLALTEKKRDSYEALLKNGADPNIIMSGRRVVTHWACIEDDSWWLQLALEHGADPNLVNTGSGRPTEGTPLTWAIGKGNLDNVKLLVKHGADIDEPSRYGCPPIIDAVTQNEFQIILFLLNAGAQYKRAECTGTSFLRWMEQRVENRNRWFRLEEDRESLDAVHTWLKDRGEDLGEPLPPDNNAE